MDVRVLEDKAKEIRRMALEMVLRGGSGHLGGSLSCTDILVTLFHGGVLRQDPANPTWPERDRFILSKGHANNTYYAILADLGYFDPQELDRYCACGSLLGNHCDRMVPGVEVSSGSLGHGLGIACGMALGAKLSGKSFMTFVILGDGESQEGSVWEAGMFAAQHGLGNLVAFLDRNRLGSEDFTEDTAGLDPVEEKWAAFGWEVRSIDGHGFEAIGGALADIRTRASIKPLMIVSNTVKGKGISFLENVPRSHHTLPKGDEIEIARRELL